MSPAGSVLVFLSQLTNEQRHILGIKSQIGKHILINLLYLRRPGLIAIIGFALMQENTFDDTTLLCNLSQLDKTAVRITTILLGIIAEPVGSIGIIEIRLILILIKEIDACSAYSYGDGSHLHLVRQIIYHLSSEIIYYRQTGVRTSLRRSSCMPFAFCPSGIGIIERIHCHETRVHTCLVLRLDGSISLHVRLSKTEINLKIRIWSRMLVQPMTLEEVP